jgi:hypothetical protein
MSENSSKRNDTTRECQLVYQACGALPRLRGRGVATRGARLACKAEAVGTVEHCLACEAVASSARSRVGPIFIGALYHRLIFVVSFHRTRRCVNCTHLRASVNERSETSVSLFTTASQARQRSKGGAPLTPSASNRSRSSRVRRLQAEPSYAHRIPLAPRVFPAALRAPGKNLRTSVRRTPVGPLE